MSSSTLARGLRAQPQAAASAVLAPVAVWLEEVRAGVVRGSPGALQGSEAAAHGQHRGADLRAQLVDELRLGIQHQDRRRGAGQGGDEPGVITIERDRRQSGGHRAVLSTLAGRVAGRREGHRDRAGRLGRAARTEMTSGCTAGVALVPANSRVAQCASAGRAARSAVSAASGCDGWTGRAARPGVTGVLDMADFLRERTEVRLGGWSFQPRQQFPDMQPRRSTRWVAVVANAAWMVATNPWQHAVVGPDKRLRPSSQVME